MDNTLPDMEQASGIQIMDESGGNMSDKRPVGRPAGSTKPDARRHKFTMLLNDREMSQLIAGAALAGMTASAYLRCVAGAYDIIITAAEWWEAKEPCAFSPGEHFHHPTVNCSTDREQRLAKAVAEYLRAGGK